MTLQQQIRSNRFRSVIVVLGFALLLVLLAGLIGLALDLSAEWRATEELAFRAGVRNLTQESYPVLGGNASPSNSGYPNTYEVLGRSFFFNATLRY